jgi:myosin heavy chain 9/10/11/14
VLDIAGFEDFGEFSAALPSNHNFSLIHTPRLSSYRVARNGLSQLQFNFVNESIQHLFDTLAITSELSLYHSEGYPVTSTNAFDVIDLAPTLEVLSSCDPKRPGVLAILAAKSAIATSDDSKFKVELSNHWAKQIEPQKRLMKPTSDRITVINEPNSAVAKQFTIRHYAGPVLYDIDGDWLASNRQELSLGIRTLLRDSNDRRYRDFITTHQGGLSQSEELTGQLRLLLDDTTTNTSLQFIRCLLPNADRSIDVVDEVMLLQQLRSNGILQAVAIAHAGFPSHSTSRDFADRYQPLLPKLLPSNADITTLLGRVQTDPSRYWIGPQRVFMKGDTLNSLEGLLSVHMEERRRRDALEAEEGHRLHALQVEEERRRHAFKAEMQQRCQHEAQQQRQHVIENEEQHARLRSIEGQLQESQTAQELMQVQLDNQFRVTTDLQRKLADVQGEKDALRAILADQQQANVVSRMDGESLQVQLDHQLRVTADLKGKLADVQAERDAVRASLDDQHRTIGNVQRHLTAVQGERDAARASLDDQQRLIDNVQRQLIAVQGERDAVRASLDDQQRVIGNVQRDGEAMRAELEQQHLIDSSHRAREGTMQVELDRQRRIIADLEGERDRSEMMSAQRDVDRLHQQSTITNLRGEQETLRNDIKQYAAKLERESSRRCLVEEDHARVVRANADRMRQLVDLVGSVTKATYKDRDDLCCLQKDMVLLVGVVKGTVSC